MDKTKGKSISIKTFACRDGGKKAQNQGRDDTSQKKTNLIQEEYLTSVALYCQVLLEQI